MKIFIGYNHSCNLNYQYLYILNELNSKFEITNNAEEADIIIFAGTCCCTQYTINYMLSYMSEVLNHKKEGAKVYMTGCMTREFRNDKIFDVVRNWINENIDVVVPQNKPNLLLMQISKSEFGNLIEDDFGLVVRYSEDTALAYISNGCKNNCSFCRNTFQYYPVKSAKIDEVKGLIDEIDCFKIPNLILTGTNVCQFGLDTDERYLLPELLEYIETKDNIKNISLNGFAFKDAIQNDFQRVLVESNKSYELHGGLESGSNKLLGLMRKGFKREDIIKFVENIRGKKKLDLGLNIISGFPTETLEDVYLTLDTLDILKPNNVDICVYTNSVFVDSSIYEQLSAEEIKEHTKIYQNVLRQRGVAISTVGLRNK